MFSWQSNCCLYMGSLQKRPISDGFTDKIFVEATKKQSVDRSRHNSVQGRDAAGTQNPEAPTLLSVETFV